MHIALHDHSRLSFFDKCAQVQCQGARTSLVEEVIICSAPHANHSYRNKEEKSALTRASLIRIDKESRETRVAGGFIRYVTV